MTVRPRNIWNARLQDLRKGPIIIVRPETVEREKHAGGLYDTLDRCYVVEFRYGDARTNLYFSILPESDMNAYRNILLGKWIKESKGWKYEYQGENLTSWALVNDNWYYFGTDGYMKTGWQEYKGDWYYLNPDDGVMRVDVPLTDTGWTGAESGFKAGQDIWRMADGAQWLLLRCSMIT